MNLLQKWGATLCALALATLLAGCGHTSQTATGTTRLMAEIPPVWHRHCSNEPATWHTDSGITARQVSAACETVVYTRYLGPRPTRMVAEPQYLCRMTVSEAGTHYYYIVRVDDSQSRQVSFGIMEDEEPDAPVLAQLADFGKVCGPLPNEG